MNNLINAIGAGNILQDFAEFLGRSNCQIIEKTGRHFIQPKDWEGLVFDGAHWKGYDKDGTIYDSYTSNIQLVGTNNFCQSFACYLWAKQGITNTKLKPNKYVYNIQLMSKKWLDYFDDRMSDSKYMKWFQKSLKNYNVIEILNTLKRLKTNRKFAEELSQSKEEIE